MKQTLVIGASTNPERYAYKAIESLISHGHPVIAYGKKRGEVSGIPIHNKWDREWRPDTVTLYLGPDNQTEYFQEIIALHPKRVIFNPGTENPVFFELLKENQIEVEIACTLVLLSIGEY